MRCRGSRRSPLLSQISLRTPCGRVLTSRPRPLRASAWATSSGGEGLARLAAPAVNGVQPRWLRWLGRAPGPIPEGGITCPPEVPVGHTILHKKRLLNRVRRIRGQVEAVERALEEEHGCAEVMLTLAASRGAIHALMVELLEEHLHTHVVDAKGRAKRHQAADEVARVFRMSLR